MDDPVVLLNEASTAVPGNSLYPIKASLNDMLYSYFHIHYLPPNVVFVVVRVLVKT